MKLKLIAAAALAMTSSVSFAATSLACDTTTAEKMVNTCAPEASLFVAGSSALGGNINAILPDLFDTTKTLVKIVDKSTTGVANGNAAATAAWYGTSKSGATGGAAKRVFVIYNKNNGSAAGVSLVMGKLAKTGNPVEANIVTVGPTKNIANTCVNVVPTAPATTHSTTVNGVAITHDVVNCTQTADSLADLAFTDVRVQELYSLYTIAAKAKVADYVQVPLGIQGFGLAVNWPMYQALQTKQIGKNLPASCTMGDITAACVPNIRRIDYATLVTDVMPAASKSAKLFGLDDELITLARRDDLSGTQATSNMFFANNACGNIPLKSTNLGGKLDVVGTVDTAKFKSTMSATSDDVKTALGASTGFVIGMLGLEWRTGSSWTNGPVKASTYNFVKIDNYSPLFNADGSIAYKARTAFANGDYPIAVTSYAVYPKLLDTKPSDKTTLAKFVFNAMKDSTKGDQAGLAYIDGVADAAGSSTPKQSKVKQPNGNNCSPLIRM